MNALKDYFRLNGWDGTPEWALIGFKIYMTIRTVRTLGSVGPLFCQVTCGALLGTLAISLGRKRCYWPTCCHIVNMSPERSARS